MQVPRENSIAFLLKVDEVSSLVDDAISELQDEARLVSDDAGNILAPSLGKRVQQCLCMHVVSYRNYI